MDITNYHLLFDMKTNDTATATDSSRHRTDDLAPPCGQQRVAEYKVLKSGRFQYGRLKTTEHDEAWDNSLNDPADNSKQTNLYLTPNISLPTNPYQNPSSRHTYPPSFAHPSFSSSFTHLSTSQPASSIPAYLSLHAPPSSFQFGGLVSTPTTSDLDPDHSQTPATSCTLSETASPTLSYYSSAVPSSSNGSSQFDHQPEEEPFISAQSQYSYTDLRTFECNTHFHEPMTSKHAEMNQSGSNQPHVGDLWKAPSTANGNAYGGMVSASGAHVQEWASNLLTGRECASVADTDVYGGKDDITYGGYSDEVYDYDEHYGFPYAFDSQEHAQPVDGEGGVELGLSSDEYEMGGGGADFENNCRGSEGTDSVHGGVDTKMELTDMTLRDPGIAYLEGGMPVSSQLHGAVSLEDGAPALDSDLFEEPVQGADLFFPASELQHEDFTTATIPSCYSCAEATASPDTCTDEEVSTDPIEVDLQSEFPVNSSSYAESPFAQYSLTSDVLDVQINTEKTADQEWSVCDRQKTQNWNQEEKPIQPTHNTPQLTTATPTNLLTTLPFIQSILPSHRPTTLPTYTRAGMAGTISHPTPPTTNPYIQNPYIQPPKSRLPAPFPSTKPDRPLPLGPPRGKTWAG
ncbi:hypothetical protein HK097_001739, partial [Rhizophlyctis rosea]